MFLLNPGCIWIEISLNVDSRVLLWEKKVHDLLEHWLKQTKCYAFAMDNFHFTCKQIYQFISFIHVNTKLIKLSSHYDIHCSELINVHVNAFLRLGSRNALLTTLFTFAKLSSIFNSAELSKIYYHSKPQHHSLLKM